MSRVAEPRIAEPTTDESPVVGPTSVESAARSRPFTSCTVLVVSRDPVERAGLVLALSVADEVNASSASGFHMAVPLIWANDPDAVVIGAMTATDVLRFAELRRYAPTAQLITLPSAGIEYGELRGQVQRCQPDDVLDALLGVRDTR